VSFKHTALSRDRCYSGMGYGRWSLPRLSDIYSLQTILSTYNNLLTYYAWMWSDTELTVRLARLSPRLIFSTGPQCMVYFRFKAQYKFRSHADLVSWPDLIEKYSQAPACTWHRSLSTTPSYAFSPSSHTSPTSRINIPTRPEYQIKNRCSPLSGESSRYRYESCANVFALRCI